MTNTFGSVQDVFLELAAVDSPSLHEDAYLLCAENLLRSLRFATSYDFYGNLVAIRHASTGSDREPFLFTFHADKESNGQPIYPEVDAGRVNATGGNSVGADNKAAFAGFLWALLTDTVDIPVEVVLTRNEENGFVGARSLDTSLLRSRAGVNTDAAGDADLVTASQYWSQIHVPENLRSAQVRDLQHALETDPAFSSHRAHEDGKGTVIGAFSKSDGINSHIQRALDSLGIRRYRIVRNAPGYSVETDDPLVTAVARAMRAAGITPDIKEELIGTESCIYNSKGIKMVTIGAQIEDVHQPTEAVTVGSLTRFAEVVCRILTDLRNHR